MCAGHVAAKGKGVPPLEVMSEPFPASRGLAWSPECGGGLLFFRKSGDAGIGSIWALLGRTAKDSLGTQALSADATRPLHCHLADGSTM